MSAPRRPGPGLTRQPGERGETLVELLVTIAIVGIAIVGVVASLGAALEFSQRDRSDADLETVLTSYAEQLERLDYETCGAANPYATTGPAALPSVSGIDVRYADSVAAGTDVSAAYLVRIDSVQYWDGQGSPAGFGAACPAGGDPGLQRITLRGWRVSDSGGTEAINTSRGQRLVLYKRAA